MVEFVLLYEIICCISGWTESANKSFYKSQIINGELLRVAGTWSGKQ